MGGGGLAPPTIAKAFSPTSVSAGGDSRLTITLSNSNAAAITLNSAFTDTLPGGVLVAALPNPITTCGGAVTATSGASTVTLATASTIPAGSCTIAVNVNAAASGSFVNTIPAGALVTTAGNNAAPASATLTATATVCPAIVLSPSGLPSGTVGVAYSQTVTGSGGTAPYTFTVSSGTLPAGLTLTTAGVLAGTPTAAATSNFTIRGADVNGCAASVANAIVIAPAPVPPGACPAITLAPSTLPNGTSGVAYTQTLTGSGGTAPYSFGVIAGALPTGLTLTAAGVLAGTPTTAGTSTFTIQARDQNGCSVSVPYTIVVAAAPAPPPVCPAITLAPSTLPNGTSGVAYTQTITGSGGTAPYSFGVISGALPAGLTLTAAGVLAGTPTTVGTSNFTVRGTDANGCFKDAVAVFVVAAAPAPPPVCPAITIPQTTLPNMAVGVGYSTTLTASGGTAPYKFGVTTGALPAGMTLTAAGVLAGTPTTAGTSTFTIRATDANACFLELSYTLVIPTAVPTLPQAFMLLLALGLAGVGYARLRRARTE